MPYTQVHKIQRTLDKSFRYINNPDKTTIIGNAKDDLADSIKYTTNGAKTSNYVFVEGYNCNPHTAEIEFARTKADYLAAHGGHERNTSGVPVVAWHLIQSFPAEENDPSLIHQIGMELAEKIGDGQYQAIVSTHVQGSHCMHNHIIFNAYPSDVRGKKYHRTEEEYKRIQSISDSIAERYGLSTILTDPSKGKSMGHYEWEQQEKGISWKQLIRDSIDKVKPICDNWDVYKMYLSQLGIAVDDSGAYVKYTAPGQTRPVRDYNLGNDYTRTSIMVSWSGGQKEEPGLQDGQKKAATFDRAEKARWLTAERMARRKDNLDKVNPDDPYYHVSHYDINGRRRSETQMILLAAIKIINADAGAFEDVAGSLKYPRNPVFAPRDWKMQQLLTSYKQLVDLDIVELKDIQRRKEELSHKIYDVSGDIRKRKSYMARTQYIERALTNYKATKDIHDKVEKAAPEEKKALVQQYAAELDMWRLAVKDMYKASGPKAKSPIMTYNSKTGERTPNEGNIEAFLSNWAVNEDEIKAFEKQRKELSRRYGRVMRVEYTVALAQNKQFCHGPKFSEEKLRAIQTEAIAEEERKIMELRKTPEMDEHEFGEYFDSLLANAKNDFEGDIYYDDDAQESAEKVRLKQQPTPEKGR